MKRTLMIVSFVLMNIGLIGSYAQADANFSNCGQTPDCFTIENSGSPIRRRDASEEAISVVFRDLHASVDHLASVQCGEEFAHRISEYRDRGTFALNFFFSSVSADYFCRASE